MASLDPFPTRPAPADPDLEPCCRWRRQHREIGLELIRVTHMHDVVSTAMRATRRQRCVQGSLRVRWRQPVTVPAMCRAFLTPGCFRVVDRFTFPERSRLPFPRTTRLLEQPFKLNNPGVATGDRFGQPCDRGFRTDQRLGQAVQRRLQPGDASIKLPDRHASHHTNTRAPNRRPPPETTRTTTKTQIPYPYPAIRRLRGEVWTTDLGPGSRATGL